MAIILEKGKDNRIIVRFPYSRELVDKIRTVDGRIWNQDEKYWDVPYSEQTINKLFVLFKKDEIVNNLPALNSKAAEVQYMRDLTLEKQVPN